MKKISNQVILSTNYFSELSKISMNYKTKTLSKHNTKNKSSKTEDMLMIFFNKSVQPKSVKFKYKLIPQITLKIILIAFYKLTIPPQSSQLHRFLRTMLTRKASICKTRNETFSRRKQLQGESFNSSFQHNINKWQICLDLQRISDQSSPGEKVSTADLPMNDHSGISDHTSMFNYIHRVARRENSTQLIDK